MMIQDKSQYVLIGIIYTCLAVLLILIVYAPVIIFGDHVSVHNEYTFHPRPLPPSGYFNERDEIHIMELYVNSQQDLNCADGFALNDLGECTSIKYHYDVYSLYLMQKLPDTCPVKALECILDYGVFILNGKQGIAPGPDQGGCSVLHHVLLHLKYRFYDPEDAHKFFVENWPASKCAVPRR